ncbi:MAG: hypothetical protein JXM79_06145 [Sedimentisphaerales bacterium]|nr:hypothetical protein [Sedimentisphaerales bacterium]
MTEREEAWVGLFLGVPMLVIPSVVAVFIAYDKGLSFAPLLMFTFTVVWGGLLWLLPYIESKFRKGKKKITFDERDQLIHKKVVMVSYVLLWTYFVAACVVTWCVVGPNGSISVNVMPLTLIGGLVLFNSVQGLVTLILSGRGGKGEKS